MASFATLPVEILDQICTILSPYRRAYITRFLKPSLKDPLKEHEQQAFKALLNLCLTSKALCKVAQPVIFHTFFDHDNYISIEPMAFLRRLGLFLRTLSENPELADSVRAIDIDACEHTCQCCYPFEEIVRDQMGWISELSAKTGLEFDLPSWESREVAEAQFQALLLMVPNLQRLNLRLPVTWELKALADWVKRKESETGTAQKFLSTVTHMELGTDADLEKFPPKMYENGEQGDVCEGVDNPAERLLVESAPNLELLCCTAGALDGFPRLPSLVSLQILLHSPWDKMLPRLVEGLPRLKRFTYDALSDNCPTPREVQNALLPVQETLQYLCIRAQSHFVTDWAPLPETKFQMTTLKGFSALRVLVLDGFAMLPSRGLFETWDSDGELLPGILPPSLVQLHVGGWNSHSSAQFQPLAKAMADAKFPHLETVSWFTHSDEDGSLFHVLDQTSAMRDGKGTGVPSEVWRWSFDEDTHAFPDWKRAYQRGILIEYPGLTISEVQDIFRELEKQQIEAVDL